MFNEIILTTKAEKITYIVIQLYPSRTDSWPMTAMIWHSLSKICPFFFNFLFRLLLVCCLMLIPTVIPPISTESTINKGKKKKKGKSWWIQLFTWDFSKKKRQENKRGKNWPKNLEKGSFLLKKKKGGVGGCCGLSTRLTGKK